MSLSVLPRSPLGKALTYTLDNWKALTRYTEASYLSIDNNHSERQIKQMVIGRKNRLFAGNEDGAENPAILFSVVVSCKLAGLDPLAYLRDVLMRWVPRAACLPVPTGGQAAIGTPVHRQSIISCVMDHQIFPT